MSLDLMFWKESSRTLEETYELATENDFQHLQVSPKVMFFRVEVLRTWPDLVHMIEPSELNPDLDQSDLSRYVLLTLPWSHQDRVGAIIRLAREYELLGYDPQAESVIADR